MRPKFPSFDSSAKPESPGDSRRRPARASSWWQRVWLPSREGTSSSMTRLRAISGGSVPAANSSAPPPPAPRSSGAAVDDSSLVFAVQSGDEAAADAFCSRLLPRVRAIVGRLLGAEDRDREDVQQQAMIALVTGIDRFRGECALEAWASSVTAHVVYKHIRRRRLERRHFEPEPPDREPASSHPGPSILARNLIARVRAHLAEMDHDRAFAFILHDIAGFDLREMATITATSVAAAQKRLVRGRAEIHERIAADTELAQCLEELKESS